MFLLDFNIKHWNIPCWWWRWRVCTKRIQI